MDLTQNMKNSISKENEKKGNQLWIKLSNKEKRAKIDRMDELQINRRKSYVNKNLETINKVIDQMKFKINYSKSRYRINEITQNNKSNALLRNVSERLLVNNKQSETRINYSVQFSNETMKNNVKNKKSEIKLPSLFSLTSHVNNLPNEIDKSESSSSSQGFILKKYKSTLSVDKKGTKQFQITLKNDQSEPEKKISLKKMPKMEEVSNNFKISSLLPTQVTINFSSNKQRNNGNNGNELKRDNSLKILPNYKIANSTSPDKLKVNFNDMVIKDIQRKQKIKLMEMKPEKSGSKSNKKKRRKGKKTRENNQTERKVSHSVGFN